MITCDENVKVCIRIRPLNQREITEGNTSCVKVIDNGTIILDSKPEPKIFSFDYVANETTTQVLLLFYLNYR